MPTSIFSLLTANIVGACLMFAQLLDYDWSRNTKFVMVCLAFVPAIVALYNMSTYPHEDKRIMSFGLSALALAFLSVVGTLLLH